MQITSGKVVSIDYTLTSDGGEVIDSSEGGQPLVYLHGNGQIIPGLEKALEGKEAGAELTVKVEAAEGYGLKDEKKLIVVPRDRIDGTGELKEGMQLQASNGGGMQIVTVVKIAGDEVTIDANHPLAGVNLNFDVKVRDVRDATPEEIDHGHVHGPGGHHH